MDRWEELGESIWERADQNNYEDFEAFLDWLWVPVSGLGPRIPSPTTPPPPTGDGYCSLTAISVRANTGEIFETSPRNCQRAPRQQPMLVRWFVLKLQREYEDSEESGFENIHLFPACGDDGLALERPSMCTITSWMEPVKAMRKNISGQRLRRSPGRWSSHRHKNTAKALSEGA